MLTCLFTSNYKEPRGNTDLCIHGHNVHSHGQKSRSDGTGTSPHCFLGRAAFSFSFSWSDASSGAQLSFHIGSASKDTLIHLKTLANLTSLSCLLLGMLVACCLVQTTKDAHRMSLNGLRWANSVCLVLSWVNRWFFLISSHDRSRKENLRYACPPALLSQAWKQILPLHAVGRVREAFHPGCSF